MEKGYNTGEGVLLQGNDGNGQGDEGAEAESDDLQSSHE